jgi:hypothetical protein
VSKLRDFMSITEAERRLDRVKVGVKMDAQAQEEVLDNLIRALRMLRRAGKMVLEIQSDRLFNEEE